MISIDSQVAELESDNERLTESNSELEARNEYLEARDNFHSASQDVSETLRVKEIQFAKLETELGQLQAKYDSAVSRFCYICQGLQCL